MPLSIDNIYLYPVKSMAANALTEATVERRGLAGDRRWLVVTDSGQFVTGRQLPMLTQIQVHTGASGLVLSIADKTLKIAKPEPQQPARRIRIWNDQCAALDAGQAAADWLSEVLQHQVRLVYQADQHHRWLPAGKRQRADDEVSFADGYPLLLIGTASLRELNQRLDTAVTMAHFRPNIVVRTDDAFVEDDWQSIEIGAVRFAVASRCSRCIFTTVDPANGNRDPNREPLATLAGYRREADTGKIMFGVNLIPLTEGTLRVQDEVTVIPG